jgi:hypothetical protein
MKYAYFVPITMNTIAADLAKLFFKAVKCHYSTPLSMVID